MPWLPRSVDLLSQNTPYSKCNRIMISFQRQYEIIMYVSEGIRFYFLCQIIFIFYVSSLFFFRSIFFKRSSGWFYLQSFLFLFTQTFVFLLQYFVYIQESREHIRQWEGRLCFFKQTLSVISLRYLEFVAYHDRQFYRVDCGKEGYQSTQIVYIYCRINRKESSKEDCDPPKHLVLLFLHYIQYSQLVLKGQDIGKKNGERSIV